MAGTVINDLLEMGNRGDASDGLFEHILGAGAAIDPNLRTFEHCHDHMQLIGDPVAHFLDHGFTQPERALQLVLLGGTVACRDIQRIDDDEVQQSDQDKRGQRDRGGGPLHREPGRR